MARVTVEDCLEHVDNRFELVLIASKRARQLARGFVDSFVSEEGDKPTVLALREIAAGFIDKRILEKQPNSASSKAVVEDDTVNPEDESDISEEIIAETQQTEEVELADEEFEDEDAEEIEDGSETDEQESADIDDVDDSDDGEEKE